MLSCTGERRGGKQDRGSGREGTVGREVEGKEKEERGKEDVEGERGNGKGEGYTQQSNAPD
jgi:hypothetical protein